jgi:PAS domain S-box-containing protein
MKKFSTDQLLTAGISVIVLTIAFVLFISVRQIQKIRNTTERVDHTHQVLQHIQKLSLTISENESYARGFVITNSDSFLSTLNQSKKDLDSIEKKLGNLVSDNPTQIRWMDMIHLYTDKRIQFSDSLVSARRQSGLPAAMVLMNEGSGKRYSDSISAIGSRMEQEENSILAQRRQQSNKSILIFNTIQYIVLGMLLVLGIFFIRSARDDIRKQNASERKFRALLEAAPDAKVIVDENGIIIMINQQTERVFGYSKEELVGKPVEILMPADLHSKHIGHRNSFIQNPKVRPMGSGLELFAVKKSGAHFPVEISLSPIHTDEGLLISASVRDITPRKKMENELRKSNAELEAFTYSVSHDLRAPLRGIIGFTNILEEEYSSQLDDEAKRITGVIKSNTKKMGQLIDDLLAFSRLGRLDLVKSPVNMSRMVNDIILETNLQGKNDHIKWEIGELPTVKADIKIIKQVWLNLISNAIKYSAKAAAPGIKISSQLENGLYVFFVKDNGVGFDNKYKDKLFRVFQRLHSENEYEGTGVGLALVEKIVSRHGGTVWAEAEINKGACFYFSLPAD